MQHTIVAFTQVAVLAGDYLLARASVLLAKLDNVDVVQIMASTLDALVQGEIMQIKSAPNDMLEMSYYLRKSYYKTASLICDACKVCACRDGVPQILLRKLCSLISHRFRTILPTVVVCDSWR